MAVFSAWMCLLLAGSSLAPAPRQTASTAGPGGRGPPTAVPCGRPRNGGPAPDGAAVTDQNPGRHCPLGSSDSAPLASLKPPMPNNLGRNAHLDAHVVRLSQPPHRPAGSAAGGGAPGQVLPVPARGSVGRARSRVRPGPSGGGPLAPDGDPAPDERAISPGGDAQFGDLPVAGGVLRALAEAERGAGALSQQVGASGRGLGQLSDRRCLLLGGEPGLGVP